MTTLALSPITYMVLYAAFICVDRNPEKDFVVQSLKRDFSINTSDAIILTLCPFLDGQNGFSFGRRDPRGPKDTAQYAFNLHNGALRPRDGQLHDLGCPQQFEAY